MKKVNLGRGLASLINEDSINNKGNKIIELEVNNLESGVFQPRKHFDQEALLELSNSIKNKGVLQPIIVRSIDGKENCYEIISGERRWRATKLAGIDTIPVIIRNISDIEAIEIALLENLQRKDLSVLEEATGYKRLQEEFQYNQQQVADAVCRSRSHIANMLRILELPNSIKDMISKNKLSYGHARPLLKVDNPEEIAYKIVKEKLNVRQVEQIASNIKKNINDELNHIIKIENKIKNFLGNNASIVVKNKNKGEIKVIYNSVSELESIVSKLNI